MIKRVFLSILVVAAAMAWPGAASAYDVVIDGIAYDFNDDGESVTVAPLVEYPANWRDSVIDKRYEGVVVIPPSVVYGGKSYVVNAIGDKAFNNEARGLTFCKATSVYLPSTIKSIGYSAFRACPITSIELPNSLISIGNGAFARSEIKAVDIPNSVQSVGKSVFYACTELNTAKLPNGLTKIPKDLFSNSGLTKITIPNSVDTIGEYAFSDCYNLTEVNIPNSVKVIDRFAFNHCSALMHLSLPNSLKTIGVSAFAECKSLKAVIIPNSVTSIGEGAFMNCDKLKAITLGKSVKSIGDYAFWFYDLNDPDYAALRAYSGEPKIITISSNVTTVGKDALVPTTLVITPDVNALKNINVFFLKSVYSYTTQPPTFDSNMTAQLSELTNTSSWIKDNLNLLHTTESSVSNYFMSDYWSLFKITSGDLYSPSLAVDKHRLDLNHGQRDTLTLTDLPLPCDMTTGANNPYSTEFPLLVYSTDPSVAEVNYTISTNFGDFEVSAKKRGQCDIIYMYQALTDTCHVVVDGGDDGVTRVKLSTNEMVLNYNEIATLYPHLDSSSTGPEFAIENDNPDILMVKWVAGAKNYQILALKPGQATLTVSCTNYEAEPAECHVFVNRAPGDINGDGMVNTGDISTLYNVILNPDISPLLRSRAEMNGDREVNIGDISVLYGIILGQ